MCVYGWDLLTRDVKSYWFYVYLNFFVFSASHISFRLHHLKHHLYSRTTIHSSLINCLLCIRKFLAASSSNIDDLISWYFWNQVFFSTDSLPVIALIYIRSTVHFHVAFVLANLLSTNLYNQIVSLLCFFH